MKAKYLLTLSISLIVCVMMAGCTESSLPAMSLGKQKRPAQGAVAAAPANNNMNMAAQRFQQASFTAEPNSSDPAMTEKVAKLQEDLIAEQQKNSELIRVNTDLEERLKKADEELEQSNKELNEANDLLVKMRIEVANWKTDVLGFREEMREANLAQLEALYKVLTILGADISENDIPQ